MKLKSFHPLRVITLALLFSASQDAIAASFTYRFFRFKPTAISNAGSSLQLSEFTFSNGEILVPMDGVQVSSGDVDPIGNEGPLKLIDGSTETKFLRGGALAAGNEVVFDFGEGSSATVDSYNFATANDNVLYGNRTPISWRLAGSDDGITWDVLDVRADVAPLQADFSFYPGFSISDELSPVIDGFALRDPAAGGTPAIQFNGSAFSFDYETAYSTERFVAVGMDQILLAAESGRFSDTPANDSTTAYTLVALKPGYPAAVTTRLVRTVTGGAANYQYLRFRINARRGGGAGAIQLSELQLFNGSAEDPANLVPIVAGSNPGGAREPQSGEDITKLFDGDPNTKWFDDTFRDVVFTLGDEPVAFDRYQLTTGNDADDRDPVGWTFEGSNDLERWNVIESVDFGYPTPTARNVATGAIPLPGASLPPQIEVFAASPRTLIVGAPLALTYSIQSIIRPLDSLVLKNQAGEVIRTLTADFGTISLAGSEAPSESTSYTLEIVRPGMTTPVIASVDVTVVPDPGDIVIAYDDFASAGNQLALVGSAQITPSEDAQPDRLRLTPEAGSQLGAAWSLVKPKPGDGFEATFGLSMNKSIEDNLAPADGLSMVIHNSADGNAEIGSGETGVAENALSIGFRTFGFAADPASRVEVRAGGEVLAFGIAAETPGIELHGFPGFSEDGVQNAVPSYPYTLASLASDPPYQVRITYVPGDLDVYIDGIAVIQNVDVDLREIGALDDEGSSFVGFTARTGGNSQANDITNWNFETGDFSTNPGFGIVNTVFRSSVAGGPVDTVDLVWNARAGEEYQVLSTDLLELPLNSWDVVGGIVEGIDGQIGVRVPMRQLFPEQPVGFFTVFRYD